MVYGIARSHLRYSLYYCGEVRFEAVSLLKIFSRARQGEMSKQFTPVLSLVYSINCFDDFFLVDVVVDDVDTRPMKISFNFFSLVTATLMLNSRPSRCVLYSFFHNFNTSYILKCRCKIWENSTAAAHRSNGNIHLFLFTFVASFVFIWRCEMHSLLFQKTLFELFVIFFFTFFLARKIMHGFDVSSSISWKCWKYDFFLHTILMISNWMKFNAFLATAHLMCVFFFFLSSKCAT